MKRFLIPLVLMMLPCLAWSAPKPQASVAPASSSGNDLAAASTEMLSVIQALSGRWAMEVTFEPIPMLPKVHREKAKSFGTQARKA